MSVATFIKAKRFLVAVILFVVPVCGAGVARCDDAKDVQMADLQRQVDELGIMVRQMQDQRIPASVPTNGDPTSEVPPPAGAEDSPQYPTSAAGVPGVSSNVPPRPTERQGIHTGGFPLAGWNNGFYMRSDDDSYELHITGQLQTDFRGYPEDVDTATSPDTFLIRRARLGLEATVLKYYEFRLLPDFAAGTFSKAITDAYVNVHYWDGLQVEMGKFKQPFSYEELIQDRYVPFMERSMIDQLTPQRDEGVMVHGRKMFGDRFDYAIALSNGDQNDSTIDTNNQKDVNTRMVVRPFNSPDFDLLKGLQFGCSYGVGLEGLPSGGTIAVSPSTLTTPSTFEWFAYNSLVAADGVRTRVSPELEYFHGSFGFATQYFVMNQRLLAGELPGKPIENVHTDGFYVMASYLLTGEKRYDYTQQIDPITPFSPYSPICNPGAWEILWRVSRLDMSPNALTLIPATGLYSREATESTVGVNWYLNKWIRTQFNWEHAWFAEPVKIGNEAFPLHTEDALYARFQIIF
jgi:phosphate-selective porin OprO/OprP